MNSKNAFFRRDVLDGMANVKPAHQVVLLVVVVGCALSVVTSQHQARKLFNELQREKEFAQQMDVEWGQLQLEQSTWATPSRVEGVALQKLQMQFPTSGQVRFIYANANGGASSRQ